MPNTAGNLDARDEFWRPPVETQARALSQAQAGTCERCGTEFVMGSRFCHLCGLEREPRLGRPRMGLSNMLDIRRLQEVLGLPLSSLIAFIIGIVCTLAAIGTGLVFTATTVLDWQAVQVWRIEWLLAAAVAFLAAILLKRPTA
jgi:hypothetical protein